MKLWEMFPIRPVWPTYPAGTFVGNVSSGVKKKALVKKNLTSSSERGYCDLVYSLLATGNRVWVWWPLRVDGLFV